jgi:hypothetical protein
MRRVLALILLAVFSFPLVTPVFAVNADSQLPACCRRDGKHRCAMLSMDLSTDMETQGPAVQATRLKCPYYPATTGSPAKGNVAILKNSQAIFAWVAADPAVPALMEAQYRVDLSRSRQKRGPPAQLS